MTDHTTDQWKQSPLLQAVRDFLAARETSANRPLYCALSGGADSVAMACALRLLGLSFTAAHVNFHLRGEESERDERFVRDFCRRHDIPLRVRHFDTLHEAHTAGESLEMAARRLRYAWFSELDGPIFVAHHAEDQAETLLLRLLRGSGLRGLAAMRAVRADGVWRPWLKVRKAEILDFLNALGQAFVTDSSNADTQFRRNFVRHRVLPVLHTLNPRSVATLSETTERLQAALSVYEVGLAALDAECWLENRGEHAVIALENGCASACRSEVSPPMWPWRCCRPVAVRSSKGETFARQCTAIGCCCNLRNALPCRRSMCGAIHVRRTSFRLVLPIGLRSMPMQWSASSAFGAWAPATASLPSAC